MTRRTMAVLPARQRKLAAAVLAVGSLLATTVGARAEDTLKVAIGAPQNWENQPAQLGIAQGFFKKRGLVLEILRTQGSGETLQVVVPGSVDIGVGVGTSGAMSAFAKGAPVRAVGNQTTGAHDLYFYVPSASPIKTMKDAAGKRIAFSSVGSSTHVTVLGLLKTFAVAAVPTATGSPASTFTQTMSGQVDIGWSSPPLGVEALEKGEIRIVARGSDVPSQNKQTVRLLLANANALAAKKDAIHRFIEAYAESIDWMYTGEQALDVYAKAVGVSLAVAKRSRDEFYPKNNLRVDRLSGVDEVMADAVALKFLPKPLTPAEQATFFQYQLPPKP